MWAFDVLDLNVGTVEMKIFHYDRCTSMADCVVFRNNRHIFVEETSKARNDHCSADVAENEKEISILISLAGDYSSADSCLVLVVVDSCPHVDHSMVDSYPLVAL